MGIVEREGMHCMMYISFWYSYVNRMKVMMMSQEYVPHISCCSS